MVNATCKADPEDFTALSDELLSVVNVSAINTVVSIIMIMIICIGGIHVATVCVAEPVQILFILFYYRQRRLLVKAMDLTSTIRYGRPFLCAVHVSGCVHMMMCWRLFWTL